LNILFTIATSPATRLLHHARIMSTTATTPSSIGVAPWRPLFLTHVSKLESPEFVLSTLQPSASSSSATPYLPRARYCIFRGMWGSLPENKLNEARKNDRVYESDMLTFTTDARMEKVPQVFASSAGRGEVEQSQGSGGGGPVEAVFWIKDVMTQWRFKGEAYIIGPDIEGTGKESSGVRAVKSRVGEGMRVVKEEGKRDWSWQREVSAHFGNLSPGMRGSFKNPAPGTPVVTSPKAGEGLGQKVSGALEEDEVARRNFRVIVIKADEVEQLDLTEPEKARRWKFTYVGVERGELGEWNKEELWP
jgi:pyridoxamine 5'-phosphate oxidase